MMKDRFIRNLFLASGIFLFVLFAVYTNAEVVQPIAEYVSFVVTTNISIEPVLEKMPFLQKIADWDVSEFFKPKPEAASGW